MQLDAESLQIVSALVHLVFSLVHLAFFPVHLDFLLVHLISARQHLVAPRDRPFSPHGRLAADVSHPLFATLHLVSMHGQVGQPRLHLVSAPCRPTRAH